MNRTISCIALGLALALGAACSDTDAGPSSTFTLRITDSPFSDAEAVLVTFSEVRIHRSGGKWEEVPFAPETSSRTCDLKKLEDAIDVLGAGQLPEGHYTQVRLELASAVIYWDTPSVGPACAPSIAAPAGRSSILEIPSDEIKLNREFDVPVTGATTMTLDFDGDRSIHETGNGRFIMSPVLSIVSVQ